MKLDCEILCRSLCEKLNLDPDKECHGLGILMPAGSKYPLWHYQWISVKHVLDSLGVDYNDPTD